MTITRSIQNDFPGGGIDVGTLGQEVSVMAGFLAINRLGDEVQFIFDADLNDDQLETLDGIVQAHDHPAIDAAAILQLIGTS